MTARSVILCASSAMISLLAAEAAYAQAPATPAAPTAAPVQELIVTGSRISRKDYVSESPIVTVQKGFIQNSGPSTLEGALNELPQFNASSSAAESTGANVNARGARANINLRGLGIQRTLVLMDGHRVQPSDSLGAVDMNSIPDNVIDNVEIITGGASAVYGSDAIAGVVNLKLKTNFQGLQLDAQGGETTRSDGGSEEISLLGGGKFAQDKGRAIISISYLNRDPAYEESRKYLSPFGNTAAFQAAQYIPNASNLPSAAVLKGLFTSYGASGTPTLTQKLGVNEDGTLFTAQPILNLRNTTAQGFVPLSNGAILETYPNHSVPLTNALTRYNGFGHFEYDLNDTTTAYMQFNFSQISASNQLDSTNIGVTSPIPTVPVTNPFIPADLKAVLASRANPNAPFSISMFGDRISPGFKFDYDYDVGQFLTGIKGKVGYKDWTYDVSGSYGKTRYDLTNRNYVSVTAFENLVDASDGGASLCSGGFNPFSYAPVSKACQSYLARTVKETTTLDQQNVDATIQGGLFNVPAGEVRFAAGVDYRRNGYSFDADPQVINSEVFFARPVSSSSGSQDAYELYGEAFVPLVHNQPFIRDLNLDAAYRYSDYNTSGGVSAYKASLDWSVVREVLFRGGYQRAVRAPSVGELFGGSQSVNATIGTTAQGAGDPCDVTSSFETSANAAKVRALCVALGMPANLASTYRYVGSTAFAVQQGNTQLQPETADTYTAGAVFKSPFENPLISHATLSVDYYYINVTNAIGYISVATSLNRCFNGDGSNPTYSATNVYCTFVPRNTTTGDLNNPLQPEFNLAAYRTSGVDLQFDWNARLGDMGLNDHWGVVSLNSVLGYTNRYEIQTLAGAKFNNYAGTFGDTEIDAFSTAHPKWKAVTSVGYHVGPADFTLTWRYIGAMRNYLKVATPTVSAPDVDPINYFDLLARYKLTPKIELRAGMENLFDTDPRLTQTSPYPGTDASTYDILGRRFTIGVNATF